MGLDLLERDGELIKENSFFNNVSSSMVTIIGVCYAVLGLLAFFIDISKVFIVGATISSFFFVVSDGMLIIRPVTWFTRFMYGISIFSGVASIVFLPVVSLSFEPVYEFLQKQNDVLTLAALGLVLIVMDIRNDKNRRMEKQFSVDVIKGLQKNNDILNSTINNLIEQNERLMKRIESLQGNIEVIPQSPKKVDSTSEQQKRD